MEGRAIHLKEGPRTSATFSAVVELADKEHRTHAGMVWALVCEALEARAAKVPR